jgi:NADH-quinone oxidoreductase subunit M
LRAAYTVFFGEVRDPSFLRLPRLTWQEYAGGAILAAVLIGTGLYPRILTEMINSGVQPVAEALQRAGTLTLGR